MSYESWRCTWQDSEQAARAAYADNESLRAQLAEVTKERNAYKATVERVDGLLFDAEKQLLATQARAARLVEALKIAQDFCNGFTAEECPDKVAIPINEALSTPINLDALHEHAAKVLIAVAEKFEHGCENAPASPGAWIGRTLRDEAAAHRAKKEGK